jgi:hypothetical protein
MSPTRDGKWGGNAILRAVRVRPAHTQAHCQDYDLMGLMLFQRDDCHLCDLALDVLAQGRAPEFESVFIDGDEKLEARYGTRVPVLRNVESGAELEWPFDIDALRTWLGGR